MKRAAICVIGPSLLVSFSGDGQPDRVKIVSSTVTHGDPHAALRPVYQALKFAGYSASFGPPPQEYWKEMKRRREEREAAVAATKSIQMERG